MIQKKERKAVEINASSMADIAFLLLIFFLVTTTIASDKGINMVLPPEINEKPTSQLQRNVLEVVMNSKDKLMIEGELTDPSQVQKITREFLTNNNADPTSSESPQKAIVSIKADRGTTYSAYIEVLDHIKFTYIDLRAKSVGLSFLQFMEIMNTKKIDRSEEQHLLYEKAKRNFPLNISEAEPTGE